MATVRLFGPARELFGAAEVDSDAERPTALRAELAIRGGPAFAALLARCALWVNGEPAEDVPLRAEDEVAVLPPVSGG